MSDTPVINNTDVGLDEFGGALLRGAREGKLPEELADIFSLTVLDGEHTLAGRTYQRRVIINWS